jgi:hypothetical protein
LKNFTFIPPVRFVFLPSGTPTVNQSLPSNPRTYFPFGDRFSPPTNAFASSFFSPLRMFTRLKSRRLAPYPVRCRYGLSLLPIAQSPAAACATCRFSSDTCRNCFVSRNSTAEKVRFASGLPRTFCIGWM